MGTSRLLYEPKHTMAWWFGCQPSAEQNLGQAAAETGGAIFSSTIGTGLAFDRWQGQTPVAQRTCSARKAPRAAEVGLGLWQPVQGETRGCAEGNAKHYLERLHGRAALVHQTLIRTWTPAGPRLTWLLGGPHTARKRISVVRPPNLGRAPGGLGLTKQAQGMASAAQPLGIVNTDFPNHSGTCPPLSGGDHVQPRT
jgi:hypothetical protein